MFEGVSTETDGIPHKYLDPPIKITSNEFELDVNDRNKQFMILSFHTPLNISLLTTAPLGWALNAKSIYNQHLNVFSLMSRVPIYIINPKKKRHFTTCFGELMQTFGPSNIRQFWQSINIANKDEDIKAIKNYFLGTRKPNYVEMVREWVPNESANAFYLKCYADGQYTGAISPQENDFFQDNLSGKTSDFNNVSFIKCVFQMAMLGAAFSTDSKFYTLTNAAIVIHIKTADNMKFAGKYWYKPIIKIEDETTVPSTADLIDRLSKRIDSDELLKKEILQQIDFPSNNDEDFKAYKFDKIQIGVSVKYEGDLEKAIEAKKFEMDKELKCTIELTKKLFYATTGLENYLKENFALSFAGIYGHSWDKLLRFFEFNQDEKATFAEFQKAKEIIPNSILIQHYGTPIASYLFDLKDKSTQNNTLQGYNALNFGKILNENLISISDRIKQSVTYTPMATPNALIPVTFSTSLLQCRTRCYRSYKQLLAFMHSRKQRDYLFDKLTQYGRRAMTVLDPYGIFMHFHEGDKGLKGN